MDPLDYGLLFLFFFVSIQGIRSIVIGEIKLLGQTFTKDSKLLFGIAVTLTLSWGVSFLWLFAFKNSLL